MSRPISVKKMERSCEEVSKILKSLAHPQRLLVLGHLANGTKTVTELVELCGVSQSQMSQFQIRLNYEGLVDCEKEGRFRRYGIADRRLQNLLAVIQSEFCGY